MGRRAAIGVHDDLAAGDAAIAVWTADYEPPCGIDVELRVTVHPALRHHLIDEAAHDLLDAFLAYVLAMLGRDHDGIGADRLSVLVGECHLALGVRPSSGMRPVCRALAISCRIRWA